MNRYAYYYVALVSALATVVVVVHDWSTLIQLPTDHLLGLGALIGLSMFSETMAVHIAVVDSKRAVRSSIGFLPLLTCVIIFPPEAAIATTVITELFSELALARVRAIWKTFINVSQSILAVALGTLMYRALGGNPGIPISVNFVAFFGLAATFFFTSTLIVSAFFAIRKRSNFVSVCRQVVGPSAINILYGLLASPIAIFAAFLYERLYIGGVLLIILPISLVRYSYLSKIQLQQINKDLLKVLIKTIETRDPYTSGHSLRVSRLARIIAEELGHSLKQVEMIETAALLHDIGKIDSIYAEIIQKQDALTEEEHRVIKTHAVKGAELLRSLTSFSDELIRGVRHHHERYDGKGYPDGLKGKEIPIAARIIMLCDAVDAMLSDRPYRSALSVEQVAEEIRRCAGSQFDPDIVSVVLRRGALARAAEQIRDETVALRELVGD
ncbi:MAG TPA: HD-GYP domain-containing protein [Longimicrobiales bacterium]